MGAHRRPAEPDHHRAGPGRQRPCVFAQRSPRDRHLRREHPRDACRRLADAHALLHRHHGRRCRRLAAPPGAEAAQASGPGQGHPDQRRRQRHPHGRYRGSGRRSLGHEHRPRRDPVKRTRPVVLAAWIAALLACRAVSPARFSEAGWRDALQRDQDLLTSGLAALVKRTLPSDPTGEMLTIIDEFAGEPPPHTRDDLWFAPDDSRALLMAQTRAAGFDIDGQEKALQRIGDAFRGAQQETPGAASARLLETGPGVFAVHTRATTQEDAERLSLIATVLIAGVLLSAYRSPLLLVLGFLPVLCGAVAGIAAVSLGFGFVHGITLGFGVTLMGESVDYAIYLFTQTAPTRPPAETLARICPPLLLRAATSVAGFSAMLLSSFTGFAQLGLLSITGLIVALATTRWLLPARLPRGFTAVPSRR